MQLTGSLVIDGRPYAPARFPNEGYAMLAAKTVQPEVSPPAVPVGKQDYGVRAGHPPFQESDRRQGWLGSIEEPRGAHARIAQRASEMAGTFQQWQDELARDNRRNLLSGFLDANWLQRSQPLVSADAASRSIQLSQALAYGWAWRKHDKPFCITGLLCELDAPGEWHYDPTSRRLFVLPPSGPLANDVRIELPVAIGCLLLDGATHVTIQGLRIEHVRAGTAVHLAGSNNLLANCTIQDCTALAVRISGRNERVAGCDIVDCYGHLALNGGNRQPQRIERGANVVDNCHCYQDRFTDRRVAIGISGVGNTLRNCLVHNSMGQAVTVRGNDHLLTQNEFCNIGYEEGDGGAVYAGGDLSGYGVIYRHNFFHHLMHVPGKVERSGLHLDDLQAGSHCVGNVFYKSAAKGIFMNGGAGHTIRDNVFLNGFRGAYNVGHNAAKAYRMQLAIDGDPSHPHRNTKENYVGRVERIVGPAGWRNEPWRSRYPRFFEVMEDDGPFGRMWPIRCEVSGNRYFNNDKGDRTIWSRVAPEALAKSRVGPDELLSPDVFVDYDALDLRFVDGANAPHIPFASIGLRLDEHRDAMPDKAHLRRALREHFRGIGSMPGTTRRLDTANIVQTGPVRRRAH
ncbi:MAG: right-handed parallel beta-helix repeat-containing protein [Planctomycetota bacterium]